MIEQWQRHDILQLLAGCPRWSESSFLIREVKRKTLRTRMDLSEQMTWESSGMIRWRQSAVHRDDDSTLSMNSLHREEVIDMQSGDGSMSRKQLKQMRGRDDRLHHHRHQKNGPEVREVIKKRSLKTCCLIISCSSVKRRTGSPLTP